MRTGLYWVAFGLIAATRLLLDSDLRVHAETAQAFDDALYVRMAHWIRSGAWLGEFDHLTLTKNPGYPLWLALNDWLGLPLLMAQSLLSIGTSAGLVAVLWRAGISRLACVLIFALLVFSPFVETRVLREGIYASALMALLAAALSLTRSLVNRGRWSLPLSALTGAILGGVWLIREEGSVLVPALLVQGAGTLWLLWRQGAGLPRMARAVATMLLVGVVAGSVTAAVQWRNLAQYGVWRLNDQDSLPFRSAYGALLSVKHETERFHVLLPREARERIYGDSPAFAELKPYIDGTKGSVWLRRGWIEHTCRLMPQTCPDFGGAWVMWAVRQAVSDAGHYSSAPAADAFYERLSLEVDDACKQGRLECRARQASIVPPWRAEYLAPLLRTLLAGWQIVLGVPVRPYVYADCSPSPAEAAGLRAFRRITHNAAHPAQGDEVALSACLAAPPSQKLAVLRGIAKVYQVGLAPLVYAGIVAFLVGLARWRRQRRPEVLLFLVTLACLVTTRMLMLSYLDITSFPTFTTWPSYVAPVYPPVIAFSGVAMANLFPGRGSSGDV